LIISRSRPEKINSARHNQFDLKEISTRSGFKSNSIFFAAFKEEYGTTP